MFDFALKLENSKKTLFWNLTRGSSKFIYNYAHTESHLICFSTFYMSFNKYFTPYRIISLNKPKGRKRKKRKKIPKLHSSIPGMKWKITSIWLFPWTCFFFFSHTTKIKPPVSVLHYLSQKTWHFIRPLPQFHYRAVFWICQTNLRLTEFMHLIIHKISLYILYSQVPSKIYIFSES